MADPGKQSTLGRAFQRSRSLLLRSRAERAKARDELLEQNAWDVGVLKAVDKFDSGLQFGSVMQVAVSAAAAYAASQVSCSTLQLPAVVGATVVGYLLVPLGLAAFYAARAPAAQREDLRKEFRRIADLDKRAALQRELRQLVHNHELMLSNPHKNTGPLALDQDPGIRHLLDEYLPGLARSYGHPELSSALVPTNPDYSTWEGVYATTKEAVRVWKQALDGPFFSEVRNRGRFELRAQELERQAVERDERDRRRRLLHEELQSVEQNIRQRSKSRILLAGPQGPSAADLDDYFRFAEGAINGAAEKLRTKGAEFGLADSAEAVRFQRPEPATHDSLNEAVEASLAALQCVLLGWASS